MPRERLIAELKRLRPRELEAILAALKPSEREQVLALLRASDPAEPMLSFEALTGLSPWLLKAADRAQAETTGAAASATPAARAAFAEALSKLAASQTPAAQSKGEEEPRWKTFLSRQRARAA
jgi:hypothetical protein